MFRFVQIILLYASLFVAPGFAQSGESGMAPEIKAALDKGDPYAIVWKDKTRGDGALDVYSVIDIDAPPEQIWQVMTSCDSALRIVDKMTSCEVIESGEGWDIRKQKVRSGLIGLTSVFRSDYDYPRKFEISKAGGDMKVQEGAWYLYPLKNGKTRVSYRGASCPNMFIPSGLLKRSMRKDAPEALLNLRAEAEGFSG